jgi:hypothetical protein
MKVVRKVKTASTFVLLPDFALDVSFHPPYTPDLAPSDFHLFTHLKQFLCSTHMRSDEQVKKSVKSGSMDWRQISMMYAYRNLSQDTSTSIFMGII